MNDTEIFTERESQVRSYCRKFPAVFERAIGSELFTADQERYIDFLNGAGALNYGHNNPYIKEAILRYLSGDNIIHALDMYTVAKREFLTAFTDLVLRPRGLDYRLMMCGSTGTNAVEAALKLARKCTGRQNVIAFHGAFHGMTLGSLACTGERYARHGAAGPLTSVTFAPYADRLLTWQESLRYLRHLLSDDHSGCDLPAAIILETVQAEGGINVAPVEWLQGVRQLATEAGALLIVDDIQVGNCRTGTFFSFERAGITPDIVTLSKSVSGFGIPMSMLLVRPQHDVLGPAQHNGTWRGNQLAFVGAKAALEYARDHDVLGQVREKEALIRRFLTTELLPLDTRLRIRGIGMIWGIDFAHINAALARETQRRCWDNGLVIELAGSADSVLKILPALTIEPHTLSEGLGIIKEAVAGTLATAAKSKADEHTA